MECLRNMKALWMWLAVCSLLLVSRMVLLIQASGHPHVSVCGSVSSAPCCGYQGLCACFAPTCSWLASPEGYFQTQIVALFALFLRWCIFCWRKASYFFFLSAENSSCGAAWPAWVQSWCWGFMKNTLVIEYLKLPFFLSPISAGHGFGLISLGSSVKEAEEVPVYACRLPVHCCVCLVWGLLFLACVPALLCAFCNSFRCLCRARALSASQVLLKCRKEHFCGWGHPVLTWQRNFFI